MKRCFPIVALLLFAACGAEEWALIPDLAGRSAAAACDSLAGPDPGPVQVERLHAVSDSTLLLVDPVAREVVELDRDGSRLGVFELGADGPRSVAMLSDAARSGDTLLVIADAGRNRLRAFRPQGTDLWTLDLGFPPQRLTFAGGRLLVTAAGMDARLPALVHEVRNGAVAALPIPLVRHVDAIARLFVNDVVLEGYPDGSALVAHHFVAPRAWRVEPRGTVSSHAVPVAEAVRASIGHLPPIPFREEDIGRIAAPVIASAADPETGDFLYLTRSGRQREGRNEKAVVRVDGRFRYVGSRLLDVNAVVLAYLPSEPGSVIVVDTDGGWFRCAAP